MSHSSKTVSGRCSEGPRRRSIVRVTMLIMLAMVTQACGSSSSSDTSLTPAGAEENVVTSADWRFQILNDDGSVIEPVTDATGVAVKLLTVYKSYRIRGLVPVDLVTSNTYFVLEQQFDNGGIWYPKNIVKVTAQGEVSGTFSPDKFAQPPKNYRLAAVDASQEPSYTVIGSSNVVRAAADTEFGITVWNTTSNDLTIKVPITYNESTKDWTYFEFKLDIGAKRTLKYFNPNSNVGFSMVLNKQKCFLSCTDYHMDFTWKPSTRQSCYDLNSLALFSSAAYTVKLSDNVDGQSSGWKTGIISGPLLGPGTADTNCTFTTRTLVGDWLKNHPVKGALIILAIVVVVVITAIIASEVLFDAYSAAAIAEKIAELDAAAEDAAYDAEQAAKQAAEQVEKEAYWAESDALDKAGFDRYMAIRIAEEEAADSFLQLLDESGIPLDQTVFW